MPYDDDFYGSDEPDFSDMLDSPYWGDEPQDDVDELTENNDFAHDSDFDNYIMEDQHLDGMYEE